jgi:bromodomain-containing factor 1
MSSAIDMPEPAAFVAAAAPAASSPSGPASSPPVGANGDATPAAKRQRKSVAPFELDTTAPASPSVTSLAPASAVGMTAAQLKFAQSVIKSLRSRSEALNFLEPVDPQALGIPHYPSIVKEPMDFTTIGLKLSFSSAALSRRPTEAIRKAALYKLDATRDVYGSAKEWEQDVRRIFNNCRLFNGPDHPISQSGDTLETLFDGQLPKLPPSETAPTVSSARRVGAGQERRA